MDVYQSVTKIKDADKIPEAITAWLEEQNPYMSMAAASYYPEALRMAIRQADKDGDKSIFDVDTLEGYLMRCLPKIENASYNYDGDRINVNRVTLTGGQQVDFGDLPHLLKYSAAQKIKIHIAQQAQSN